MSNRVKHLCVAASLVFGLGAYGQEQNTEQANEHIPIVYDTDTLGGDGRYYYLVQIPSHMAQSFIIDKDESLDASLTGEMLSEAGDVFDLNGYVYLQIMSDKEIDIHIDSRDNTLRILCMPDHIKGASHHDPAVAPAPR